MGCGCRGKAKTARQVVSFTNKVPSKQKVLAEVANQLSKPTGNKELDEKRKVEKKRREEILKALARPQ